MVCENLDSRVFRIRTCRIITDHHDCLLIGEQCDDGMSRRRDTDDSLHLNLYSPPSVNILTSSPSLDTLPQTSPPSLAIPIHTPIPILCHRLAPREQYYL